VDVKQHKLFQQPENLSVAPNPFRTQTTVTAHWDKATEVDIVIYNGNGLRVKTLQQGKQLPGSCTMPWDGTDDNGNLLPAGVYYVAMRVDGKEMENVKVVKE